jgi:hypothetical protein
MSFKSEKGGISLDWWSVMAALAAAAAIKLSIFPHIRW